MVTRYHSWDKFRAEYKTYPIGKNFPSRSTLGHAFQWETTPQGFNYWSGLSTGKTIFLPEDYNNIAAIYGDPPLDDNVSIEDCL